ncbi:hypothetical protein DWW59_03655 [Firmicutes bacterium AF16-15]|nr:hypothetical protein DWW59_03655 [Firmicutes bacterium AF16-15]
MEHQQENKHEQSEYLFSPDVTTTKSRSAKHGNGKAVGFWSDKRVGNSNRSCPFLKQTEIQILLMFVKDFFLKVAQKKGRTKRTHQIAGFETMM